MEIIWSKRAINSFKKTLDFWDEYTGSSNYSDKIEKEASNLLENISKPNVLYYGRYSKVLNLYVRGILKNSFLIYFSVDEIKKQIIIRHFRSSRQKPLEQ